MGKQQGLRSGVRRGAMVVALAIVAGGLRFAAHGADIAPMPVTLTGALGSTPESVTQLPDGHWFGLDRSGTALVLASDPQLRKPERRWPLLEPRRLATVDLLPSGRVLIWGGIDRHNRVLDSGLWFEPRSETLSDARIDALAPRAGHSATVLTDGRLLIVGGWKSSGVATAELWNERSGRVQQPTVDASYNPVGAASQLRSDGSVRLDGALSQQGQPIGARYLFKPWTGHILPLAGADIVSRRAEVAATIPASHAVDVSPYVRIAVRFGSPARLPELTSSIVTLVGPGGRTQVDVTPVEQGQLLFVSPRQPLLPSSRYTLLIQGAYTTTGKPIPMFVVDFRTAALGADGAPTAAGKPGDNVEPVRLSTGASPAEEPCGATARPLPCQKVHTLKDGVWTPGRDNVGSRWRVYGETLWPTRHPAMARTAARYHVTALRGRVMQVDDKPVANVEVSIGTHTARTNEDGWFLIPDAPPGRQEVYVDGTTATTRSAEYGQFVVGTNVREGQLNELPYVMYLPKISAKDKIRIPAPLDRDTVLTHPNMPGLEIHLPAGTVIRDRKGHLVTELAIVPTPVNRAPFPVAANYPMYFTLEPGGAVIQGLTPEAAKGIRVVYPNYDRYAAGTQANFWIYDPRLGWRVYGNGRVSPDGRQFVAEPGVALYQTMGGSYNVPSNDPAPEPDKPNCSSCAAQSGSGAATGDPIDLRTGSFDYSKTDISVPDLMPISLGRSYRPHDNIKRAFGTGTTMNYGYTLNSTDYSVMHLVLPNGSFIPFYRTSGSGAYGTWQGESATTFNGAVISAAYDPSWGYGYFLTRRSGDRMFFGAAYHNSGASPMLGIEDRNGNRVDLVYSGGLLTRIASPSGRYIDLTYDTRNRISTAKDHTGRTWTYNYIDHDLLSRITFPDGTHEDIQYNWIAQLPPNDQIIVDHKITAMYNRRGIREILNEYERIPVMAASARTPAPAQAGAQSAAMQASSDNSFTYGQVVKQTLADGSFITIDYRHQDASGYGTLVTEPDGRKRRLTFGTGRYPLTDTIGYGTPLAQTVRFERDAQERITARIDATGRRTEYQYDGYGQVTRVTWLAGTPEARSVSAAYTADGDLASITDHVGRSTRLTYANRCLSTITDPLGRVTQLVCNGAGQPVSVTDPLGNTTEYVYEGFELVAIVDPLGRATGFGYDTLGRLIVVRDPAGRIARRELDTNGRVTKVVDPSGNVTQIGYDANGNVGAILLAHGNGVTYDYDNRDRLLKRTDALGQAERWTYDAVGRVKTSTDRKNQTTTIDYDALGRAATVTYADASTQTATYDSSNRLVQLDDSTSGVLGWQYNNLDQVVAALSPQGNITYEYDEVGRRSAMVAASQARVQYEYDTADQLTRIVQGSEIVNFKYDALGRRTQMVLPNGVATGYAYDAASQLTGIAYVKADLTTIGTLGYAYNDVGQRVAQTGTLADDVLPPASTGNAFDDNHRQTQSAGTLGSYDANGNLTDDGRWFYRWNARNQLTEVRDGTTRIATYSYDPLGRRIRKADGYSSTEYLYDGLATVQEKANDSANHILPGPRIDERIARTDLGGRTYLLADAIGSTRLLTNSSGAVVQRYDYDPYGTATQSAVGYNNPYQYTGRERDFDDLYYYRARYYRPSNGRFISEDPLKFGGGDWNTYAYVRGNPLRYTDPLGLMKASLDIFPFGAGGGIDLYFDYTRQDGFQFDGLGLRGGLGEGGGLTFDPNGERPDADVVRGCGDRFSNSSLGLYAAGTIGIPAISVGPEIHGGFRTNGEWYLSGGPGISFGLDGAQRFGLAGSVGVETILF